MPSETTGGAIEGPSFFEVVATTRAIRRYRPDPIPPEDLNRLVFAASRAPSGSNRQPFRFLVLRDGPRATAARHLLGSTFREMWSAKRVTDRYDRGSGDEPSSPKARMAMTMQQYVDDFETVPVVVLACLIRWRDPDPTEGGSVYPACQNLLLAARALGYGGVMTMWHKAVEPQLKEVLAIPEDVTVSATLSLGRPAGGDGAVRRRPLAELVFEDEWGATPAWVADPPGTRFTAAGPPRG